MKIIDHPYFQRLRRITQTGMSNLVYPGATHTRFHHALGALHLMHKAITVLKNKSVPISKDEELATYIAILLHDIGHGPYSHALENTIVEGRSHEELSIAIMEELNVTFDGALDLCLQIFKREHPKTFLSQLIASQLDVDRLDYLKRDSFYTGVVEGNTNSDRLISMMNVAENELVIEEKGIYSVEKFLISRSFMYWQVYLHKTSVAAEIYLIQALKRAKELSNNGTKLRASDALQFFLTPGNKMSNSQFLERFTQLDDMDIGLSLKIWQNAEDPILATLCKMLMQRRLPKARIQTHAIAASEMQKLKTDCDKILGIKASEYFVHNTPLKVQPYKAENNPIYFKSKSGDKITLQAMQQRIFSENILEPTEKHHLCYLDLNKNRSLS